MSGKRLCRRSLWQRAVILGVLSVAAVTAAPNVVRAEGTPLAEVEPIDPLVTVRTIATARILMPASRVRLAAGRQQMSRETVTLCFLAGANSIFTGERLLTTPNPRAETDEMMLNALGMRPMQHAGSHA